MEKDELKLLQEKHRKEAQEIRADIKARKARTHRLIVRGAILEKAFPESVTMEDEELLQVLIRVCASERARENQSETEGKGM